MGGSIFSVYVLPIQIAVKATFVPPSSLKALGTVALRLIIVLVFGGEVHGPVRTESITSRAVPLA